MADAASPSVAGWERSRPSIGCYFRLLLRSTPRRPALARRFGSSRERRSCDLAIVEVPLRAGRLLVVLVTFAGDEHDVVVARNGNRSLDSEEAVRFDEIAARAAGGKLT